MPTEPAVEIQVDDPALPHPLLPWQAYAGTSYLLGDRIASGGMGTVHLGLKRGALGFQRLLAVKRLHGHLAHDPDFVARFKDEIRLVSRLAHPNVVETLDVLEVPNEVALVMEFIDGVTLHELLKEARASKTEIPIPVAVGILSQALHGLHAAHELTDEDGRLVHLVHRDVSPQNIMISKHGLVKVLDFGVAKASCETHVTRTGQLSGKASYMSPEQVSGNPVDRRTDVFAAGVVLWEVLTGQRLFRPAGTPEGAALINVLDLRVRPPSGLRAGVAPALDRIVLRALDRDPARRFGSARDFALAIEEAVPEASISAVADGVSALCAVHFLQQAKAMVALRARLSDLARVSEGHADSSVLTVVQVTRTHDDVVTRTDVTTRSSRPKANDAELLTSDVQGVPVDALVTIRAGRSLWAKFAMVLAAALPLAWLAMHFVRDAVPPTSIAGAAGSEVDTESTVIAQDEANLERSVAVVSAPALAASTMESTAQIPIGERPSPATALSEAAVSSLADSSHVARSAPKARRTGSVTAKHSVGAPTARPSPASQTRAAVVKRSASDAVSAPVPPNCAPPTYTDADGIRHFKPECL